MSECPVCGGRGAVECADVYKNLDGESVVLWVLSSISRCVCWYREELLDEKWHLPADLNAYLTGSR